MADEPVPGGQAGAEDAEPDWPAPERPVGQRLAGAAMRGLYRAIYGGHDQDVVIVADASGDPPSPDGLDLHLDPDHPEASTVVVRRGPRAGDDRPPTGAVGEDEGGSGR